MDNDVERLLKFIREWEAGMGNGRDSIICRLHSGIDGRECHLDIEDLVALVSSAYGLPREVILK